MKKFLVTTMLALTAASMIAEATARPMGGKRSIGRQSQAVRQMRAPAPAPAPAPMTPMGRQAAQPNPAAPMAGAAAGAAGSRAMQQQRRPSMWKGLLGGALLGLGLGALFSHFGIGGAMASMLSSILMIALLALAVMFIVRMFRRKDTPANPAFRGGYGQPVPAGGTPEIGSGLRQAPQSFNTQPSSSSVSLDKGAAAPHVQWGVPGDFDSEAFLRHAKSSFIRMQAAWDKGDVADLREFTTPEVFAELRMQIQERGGNADFTDVVNIDAQLLGIETSATDYLASVQFNGSIRTAPNAPAEPFAEVWNMEKPLDGSSGWVLAGIQQLS
ncbi:Tim44 domain-containing protein [Massilia sp. Se16.2.3]|uniref:Tim44 domain-containing protein n=1 Tax=Massilia sp. Se16.2.3 TaxID=2709303 RepID=UPI00160046FA|nr:Tim44-like domain-containing protein [Massilia sp. Se16.2.3]QNA98589.1 Tim44 domain-containing protein [Massilia sp. Se16.2.3]